MFSDIKLSVLNALLCREDYVTVVVRVPSQGLELPSGLKEGGVILNIGHRMAIPIPDLVVNKEGIFGTLSFNRVPFYVTIPWEAVSAILDPQDSKSAGSWEPRYVFSFAPSDSGETQPVRPSLKLV